MLKTGASVMCERLRAKKTHRTCFVTTTCVIDKETVNGDNTVAYHLCQHFTRCAYTRPSRCLYYVGKGERGWYPPSQLNMRVSLLYIICPCCTLYVSTTLMQTMFFVTADHHTTTYNGGPPLTMIPLQIVSTHRYCCSCASVADTQTAVSCAGFNHAHRTDYLCCVAARSAYLQEVPPISPHERLRVCYERCSRRARKTREPLSPLVVVGDVLTLMCILGLYKIGRDSPRLHCRAEETELLLLSIIGGR